MSKDLPRGRSRHLTLGDGPGGDQETKERTNLEIANQERRKKGTNAYLITGYVRPSTLAVADAAVVCVCE